MFTDESFEKKAESFASDYEEAYDEMLDEMGAAALSQYSVSRMLRETDPIAYEVGMNDYEYQILADHQDEGDDSPYKDMFDDNEELTPEGKKMLKEMYDEMLDEFTIDSLLETYNASRLLKETDPIAYRVGLSDYESSMEEDDRNVYRDMAMQRKGMMAETFGAETAFDIINIEYMEDGEETFDYPEEMLVSVETREDDHYTHTKDSIRVKIKSYIRRNFGNDVEVVDFLAFPIGSGIEIGQKLEAESFGAEEMCQMCGEKADGMIDEKFAICHDCDTSFGSFERSKGFKKFGAEDTIEVSKEDMYADFKIRKWIRAMEEKGFSYIIRKDQTGVMYDEEGNKFYSQTPEFLVYEIDNIDDITNWIETDAFGENIMLYISEKHNEIYTKINDYGVVYGSRNVRYLPAKGIGLAYGAETFEASERKCGACGETGHNARTCESKKIPFSTGGFWREKTYDGIDLLGLPLVDASHVAMISKVIDGEILKEPNARVRIPDITWKEEPITMTWGELTKKCKNGRLASIGESTYDCTMLLKSFAYLPKNTVLTLYTGKHWPLKATFEYGGEEWILFLAPRVENYYAETFGAEESGLTRLPSDEPNFDPQKADRNKDGKISSWERTVGNKVAKGIREGRKTSSKGIDTFAEPFEDIGISKPYARLGVIAAGITALAFGVKKLRK